MSTTTAPPTSSAAERKDALVGRLFQAAGGVFETFTVYLGDRLGYYEILAAEGPLTARQLAARTGTNPRYAREWLEQQAVAGIVHVVNPDARADERGFYLPEGHDEVLANPESLDYMAPLAQILAGAVRPLPQLADAFRAGDGIPYEDFGRDLYEGQARLNRAPFLQLLGQEWLPTMPGLRDRLESDPPARIADFGCGAGWSAIGVANTYPKVLIDGFDLDAPSIEMARANAVQAGVADRVRFDVRDAGDSALAGSYDLAMALECIHDMSNPVEALATMRRLVHAGGAVFVLDEKVDDCFSPTPFSMEWFMYGWSVLHCLPAGMAGKPSACTGTVMRPDTFRGYAIEAGFRDVEVLSIEHPLFRGYWLKQ